MTRNTGEQTMKQIMNNIRGHIKRRVDALVIFFAVRTKPYRLKDNYRWIAFKAGDWIIASRPSHSRDYMTIPLHIIEVTEAHIIYEIDYRWSDKPLRRIMPQCELEERRFVLAAPAIVETACRR